MVIRRQRRSSGKGGEEPVLSGTGALLGQLKSPGQQSRGVLGGGGAERTEREEHRTGSQEGGRQSPGG